MSPKILNVALAMGPGVAPRIFSARSLESLNAGLRLLSPEPMGGDPFTDASERMIFAAHAL